MTETVLIVDDEPTQREIIRHVVDTKLHYRSISLAGGKEAIDYILQGKQPIPDLILLDLSIPDISGMDVIREVLAVYPHMPIIILTMYGDIEHATSAMRAGASDFLSKPVTVERLGVSIRNTLRTSALRREVDLLNRMQQGQIGFGDLIGISPAYRSVVEQGKEIAAADTCAVLEGERGVGKISLGRAIHGGGRRRNKPFVVFDCRGIPEFPAVRFPLREAGDGTLFLHQFDALSPSLQERLLKEAAASPCRMMASCIRSAESLASQGRIRRELLARFGQARIHIPPLRERREDIQPLAEYFLKTQAPLEGVNCTRFSPAALGLLVSHSWQGNVRQLRQAVQRAMLFARREMLDIDDFQPLVAQSSALGSGQNGPLSSIALERHGLQPRDRTPLPVMTLVNANGQLKRLEQVESELIRFAINYYAGHMSEVARRLGIGRSTLYRKMQEINIPEVA